MSALFGVPLPLCSCGVIPTGAALYKNGASKGGTISFLISTPQTGVDSILATFSLLGLPFAVIRPIAAFVTGITGGLITAKFTQTELSESSQCASSKNKNLSTKERIIDVFKYGFVDFIQSISKWLVIGLVLAAIISSLIPNDLLVSLNLSPMLQMTVLLVISIPLYVCATGTIPLATVLILKGISPGAAFVLLMAGPATNAATITTIGKVLGKRSLFTYLSTIIVGALAFGLLIDYVLPAQWFTLIANKTIAHEHLSSNWWQIASGILFAALVINGFIQKDRKNRADKLQSLKFKNMKTEIVKVEGMSCNHCKMSVENNLKNLDFVDDVQANLADNTVTLQGDNIDLDKVRETVESLGFSYKD